MPKRKPKNNRPPQTRKIEQAALPDKDKPVKKSEISGKTFAVVILGFVAVAGLAGYIILQANQQGISSGDDPVNNSNNGQSLAQQGKDNSSQQAPVRNKINFAKPKKTWEELDNTNSDGWQTETFSEHANHQLKELGHLLTDNTEKVVEEISSHDFSSLITLDFNCDLMQPANLSAVFEDQGLVVERSVNDPPSETQVTFEGFEGLAAALEKFRAPFENAEDVRFKFKLFRVEPVAESNDEVVTRQYLGVSGKTPLGMLEQNSTWIIRWKTDGKLESDAEPLIKSISVVDFEQIQTRSGNRGLFEDVTKSALDQNTSFKEQLLHGYNYWLDRTETRPYWERLGTPGLAIGDVNGDGLEDVYLCQEHGIPNLLFIQNADGSVTDISKAAGVDWIEDCRGVLLLDLDNDGDQDLIVAATGGLVLSENDGKANFKIRTVLPVTDDVKSICAADYDNDGRVDIYSTAYYTNVFEGGKVENTDVAAARTNQVIYDVNTEGKNTLYRNIIAGGDWNFEDVTQSVGLDKNNSRRSLAAAWEDFDNDGDQDLYVANDYGLNCFYRNDDGFFHETAVEYKIEDNSFAMSSAWGDYNRDGFMDLYVGNMFSAAGNRVTYQQMFKPGTTDEERAKFQHLARGNSLFKNKGDGTFDDVTLQAEVNVGRWAWSTNFIDLNNDGWQDIVVANGMITTEDTGDC